MHDFAGFWGPISALQALVRKSDMFHFRAWLKRVKRLAVI
jgi:hypothetical protein